MFECVVCLRKTGFDCQFADERDGICAKGSSEVLVDESAEIAHK